jgi:hypothetical protein
LDWEAIKAAVALWTGLERDALHIYVALLLQVGSAALLRRSLGSPLPWLVVLVFALLNEGLDIYRDRTFEKWEEGAALHDLWNTMLAPSLLLLLARFAPGLMGGRRAHHQEPHPGEGRDP